MRAVEPEELAEALTRLAHWAQQHSPRPEPPVRRRLREHFGAEPVDLPVVGRPLQPWDRPNLQVALDAWLEGREHEVLGLPQMMGYRAGLMELVRGGEWAGEIELGGVERITVPLGEGEAIACVQSGLWLVGDGPDGPRCVVMLKSVDHGAGESLALEVMAPTPARAEAVLDGLRRLMAERNVYRGRVLELRSRHFHDDEGAPLTVHALPPIERDRIVLADGVLERIERQALGMARHAERLRASGRHLRRGLLLHGPPGVGKTLTAMYLAHRMRERTVVLLTGQSVGAVRASVDLATALQPAMVILEDADLVALSRAFGPTNAILFELLNAMDGLDADHDVLFLLTTNRADLLEPALAARPGRIDQAVELAPPDAAGRGRLLDLYGEGLQVRLEHRDELIADLEGTTPAFIRELLRRAALIAAERSDGPIAVEDGDLTAALAELRRGDDDLTPRLLGAQADAPFAPPDLDLDDDDDGDGPGPSGWTGYG
jgi:hypothetical protein